LHTTSSNYIILPSTPAVDSKQKCKSVMSLPGRIQHKRNRQKMCKTSKRKHFSEQSSKKFVL